MVRVLQRGSNSPELKLKLGAIERERERGRSDGGNEIGEMRSKGEDGLAREGPLMLTNDNTRRLKRIEDGIGHDSVLRSDSEVPPQHPALYCSLSVSLYSFIFFIFFSIILLFSHLIHLPPI